MTACTFVSPAQVELANKRAPLEERKQKRAASSAATDATAQVQPAAESAKPPSRVTADKPQPGRAADAGAEPGAQAAGPAAKRPGAELAAAVTVDAPKPAKAALMIASAAAKPGPAAAGGKAAAAAGRAAAAAGRAAAGSKAGAEKHKLLRAVALGGLTADLVAAALALAKAAGPVEEVLDPAPAVSGTPSVTLAA